MPEIPTNGRTPSPHEYWGFHMAKLKAAKGGALKKYTYEIGLNATGSYDYPVVSSVR